MGGAVGDAWGSRYERMPPPFSVDFAHGWTLTDDTQLTLATCAAIVAEGCVNPERIAAEFAQAFRTGTLSGLGASTYQALESLAAGGHWALVGRKGDQAAGNGAAMRIAPLAFCLDVSVYQQRQVLRDVCRITHHNDEAYAGALAIVLAIQAASTGIWTGGAGLISHVARKLPDSAVRDRMLEIETLNPLTALRQLAGEYGNSGYTVESVPLSLFAAQQAHCSDFTSWIRGIIEAGGDTDTNASMAGQVAGCCVGASQIPDELIARIPDIEHVRVKMAEFAEHILSSGK
jgi:ADP-ribosylglycohydrolase